MIISNKSDNESAAFTASIGQRGVAETLRGAAELAAKTDAEARVLGGLDGVGGPLLNAASRVPRISFLLCDTDTGAVAAEPVPPQSALVAPQGAFSFTSPKLAKFQECASPVVTVNRGFRYTIKEEEDLTSERKARKNFKLPEDIVFTGGFLRNTMLRYYDTEVLRSSDKKYVPGQDGDQFAQTLKDVRQAEVLFENQSVEGLTPFLEAKAGSLGPEIRDFRTIIALQRRQVEHQVSLQFGINPDQVEDKSDVFHFSIISRKCEHDDPAVNITSGWMHLIATYELALLLEFIFGDIDENIWANDELLSAEVANDPKKRYQSRMRSRYKGAIFITVYASRKLNKNTPGFLEGNSSGEEEVAMDACAVGRKKAKIKIKRKTLRLKAAIYDQMLSYRIGVTGQPSHSLVKVDKLKWIIERSVEAYSWVNPSKAPAGGYKRLF
ncbi:ABL053Wp [Eremothecium gossypii ATCC 10895]|uniref:ABL053Wp n=1 Tax=Eremothecium gossypii (strain ATCC 10895 / CBS 109.51 / FGSC 9923 / NRRL Y-1056) TaxID=284811 RepID=Q75DS9_EREGS|nr:ABL053Wp [Eremothecium gossypii ATCC 10895]AAS50718.1 ABL053Wp [Eremothecium gossypii ATCC 10895]AEY95007.1 FABL053Wp [Eremothecium gossypii FDAG1]